MEPLALNESLRELAESLAPSAQETSMYHKEVDRFVHMLKNEGMQSGVDRVRLGGAIVTGTNIKGFCNADILLYVSHEPPYNALLESLKNTVAMFYRWQPNGIANLTLDSYGVLAVELKNGLQVNVILGKNFLKSEEKRLEDSAQDRRQHERSVEWLKQFRNQPARLLVYSSHLSPTATEFTLEQLHDHLVLSLIRVCKHWLHSISGLPYIHKLVSTVELLAITAAAKHDRKDSKRSLLSVFRNFLEFWLEMALHSFVRGFDYPEKHELYYLRDVAAKLRDERPLLLDPVDFFSNRLKPIKDAGAIPAFRECAQTTLHRLDRAESKGLTSMESLFAKQEVSRMFHPAHENQH